MVIVGIVQDNTDITEHQLFGDTADALVSASTPISTATSTISSPPVQARLNDDLRELGLRGVRNVRSILHAARQTDTEIEQAAAEPKAA